MDKSTFPAGFPSQPQQVQAPNSTQPQVYGSCQTPPPPSSFTLPDIESATSEFQAGVTACLRSWSALRTAVQSEWGGVNSLEKAEYLRQHIYNSFQYKHRNSINHNHSIIPNQEPSLDISELEEDLAIYLEEQFSVVPEDDSEKQVAELIYYMWKSCLSGDFQLARQTRLKADGAVTTSAAIGGGSQVVVQSHGELDEDSDDEEMMDDTEIMTPNNNHDMNMDSNPDRNLVNLNHNHNLNGMTVVPKSAVEYANDVLFGLPPGKGQRIHNGPPPRQLGEPEPKKTQPDMDDDGFVTVSNKGKGKRGR